MRARVCVGVTSRCSTGPIRSGLMENWIASSSLGDGATDLARRELQELVGIDGDGVGVDRSRGGDRSRDDVGLGRQALHPRGDDVGAKLVEQQEADHQHHEAAKVENDNAAGERGGKARGEEPPRQPGARPQP